MEDKNSCLSSLSQELHIPHQDLAWLYGTWGNWNQWYRTYTIPKRAEGFRVICAPQGLLKMVQRRVNDLILQDLQLSSCCHGFVKKHSIITNAASHVQKEVILSLDLKDFFPSITSNRVFGVFKNMGRSIEEARFLTRLCTYNGSLPQGSPSSPAVANRVCNQLDKRLAKLADYHQADYSRYADDLTFSGGKQVLQLLPLVRNIVAEEGFSLAEHKTQISKSHQRQVVTGLTVNGGIRVQRDEKRRIRAMLHHAAGGKLVWNSAMQIGVNEIRGYYAFLKNIEPEYAAKLSHSLHSKYLVSDASLDKNLFWLAKKESSCRQ